MAQTKKNFATTHLFNCFYQTKRFLYHYEDIDLHLNWKLRPVTDHKRN